METTSSNYQEKGEQAVCRLFRPLAQQWFIEPVAAICDGTTSWHQSTCVRADNDDEPFV